MGLEGGDKRAWGIWAVRNRHRQLISEGVMVECIFPSCLCVFVCHLFLCPLPSGSTKKVQRCQRNIEQHLRSEKRPSPIVE